MISVDIEKEINIAIKVRDLLEKHFNFNEISHELKLSRYKLFKIYNKYFEKYNDEVIDFDIIGYVHYDKSEVFSG